MASTRKTDDPFKALGEALVAAWGPAITALTEYFGRIARIPALVERIAATAKAGRPMALSAEDVKDLCVLLNSLSDKKKA